MAITEAELIRQQQERIAKILDFWLSTQDWDTPQYEDELPADITDAEYDAWYAKSKVIYGVRMGPKMEGKE